MKNIKTDDEKLIEINRLFNNTMIKIFDSYLLNKKEKKKNKKLKNNYEEMITIKLTEKLNSIKNTYALYSTDKDVNILFVKKEKFENDPKKYKLLENLDYNYKVYLNKKNEILFATTSSGKTVVGISEENFENFKILQEIF